MPSVQPVEPWQREHFSNSAYIGTPAKIRAECPYLTFYGRGSDISWYRDRQEIKGLIVLVVDIREIEAAVDELLERKAAAAAA